MNRFRKSDYNGYSGALPLPSGEPLIGEAILPFPDRSEAREFGEEGELVVEIVVSCSDASEGVTVGVFFIAPNPMMVAGVKVRESELVSLELPPFPCELDAIAFASLVESGRLSLSALEALGGRVN